MQRICFFLFIIFFFHLTKAQVYDYSIGRQTEKVDSVLHWIYAYEQIGPKPFGSKNLERTSDWIIEKYKQFGYTQIALDTFYYASNQGHNIIVEKAGLDTNKWIILGAHYDSVIDGPGANDNGSGVVACLQIARLIKDIPLEVGVRFIHFSGEEIGLIGSKHYVANTLNKINDVELMINLDQIGGTKGIDNSNIKCERDEDEKPTVNNALSYVKTDTLATLIRTYTSLIPIISQAYSSDYMPFEDSAYVITGLYQASYYPYYHTPNDITANIDIEATTESIKGALAATMHFARHLLPLSIRKNSEKEYMVFPNPATQNIFIQSPYYQEYTIRIFDFIGQEKYAIRAFPKQSIPISELPSGFYQVTISLKNQLLHQSKLIIAEN